MLVLSRKDIEALGLEDLVPLLNGVIDGYLVGALSHLPLPIEHETATKGVYLVIKWTRGVALSSLDALAALIVDILPFRLCLLDHVGLETSHSELCHLFISIIVQATEKESPVVDRRHGSALPWSWAPSGLWHLDHSHIE